MNMMVYLRRAFQRGGGMFLPLILSILISFVLLFAAHNSLPDNTGQNDPEMHHLIYVFPNGVTSDALSVLENDVHADHLRGVCTVSLTQVDGVCVFGVWSREENSNDWNIINSKESTYQMGNNLLPTSSFAHMEDSFLMLNNASFTYNGKYNDATDITFTLPPLFYQSIQNPEVIQAFFDQEAPVIHNQLSQKNIQNDLVKVITPDQLELSYLRSHASEVCDHVEGIYLPIQNIIENHFPIYAICLTTFSSASEWDEYFSSLWPHDEWKLYPDYIEQVSTFINSTNSKALENGLTGMIPFFGLLLLSQMVIWALWMDRFEPAIHSLHLQGFSYNRQAVTLCAMVLLLEMASYLIGLAAFLLSFHWLKSMQVLWRFEWRSVAISFAAFMVSHGVYTIFYYIVRRLAWKRGNQL